MCTRTIRDLDPDVVTELTQRAARNGRSLEAEVRALLARAVVAEPETGFAAVFADEFGDFGAALPAFERSDELPRAADVPE